jgi:hypothetical protein
MYFGKGRQLVSDFILICGNIRDLICSKSLLLKKISLLNINGQNTFIVVSKIQLFKTKAVQLFCNVALINVELKIIHAH